MFGFYKIDKVWGERDAGFRLIFFEVVKKEWETAFWIVFVNLEIARSISRGQFRGVFRDKDSSNFAWKSFQSSGPDERNRLVVGEAILAICYKFV
jgi:hypothetical protein